MTKYLMHRLESMFFLIIGCGLIGYETNWKIGVATLFILWSFFGFIEIMFEFYL